MDGELSITGSTEQPLINGELILDSVSVLSRQYGANFLFDNRPVQLKNNRLIFDKFAIYTTGKNPFTIDGYVDFRDMSRPDGKSEPVGGELYLIECEAHP